MVQRVRAQLAQTKAEAKNLRDIIEEVISALPQIGGEAGAAIAAEILKALPPAINATDPSPHGGYAALPAPTAAETQPHLQLGQGQGQGQPQQGRPTRALPAQGQTGGEPVVMGAIPEGFPLDAIPPEFRAQAARQSGQVAPTPAQRFGVPRPAPQRQQAQAIDVPYQEPYHQPGTPQATIQRNVGLSNVISEGRGPANERVMVGRLAVNGRPAGPASGPSQSGPHQQRPPGKLAGLQAAIAKARTGNG